MAGGPKTDTTTTNTKGSNIADSSSTSSNLVNALTGGETSGTTTGYNNAQTAGTTAAQQYGQQDVSIPDWLKNFVGGATGVAGTSLSTAGQLAGGYQIPPEALKALSDTAGGNYLYGGPQQQAFIDAAVRGASPGIFSQFGAAGGGGGGLQKAALDQAAVDAYAKLYQGERGNQMTAATALPGISQIPFNMQTQLAGLAGGLPGQFSPFLGALTSGGSFGQTSGQTSGETGGTTFGRTSGYANTQTTGTDTSHSTGSNTGQTQEIKPLYQTPWWQTALGAGALAANFIPGIGPALSMGMNAGSGLLGGGAFGNFMPNANNMFQPGYSTPALGGTWVNPDLGGR